MAKKNKNKSAPAQKRAPLNGSDFATSVQALVESSAERTAAEEAAQRAEAEREAARQAEVAEADAATGGRYPLEKARTETFGTRQNRPEVVSFETTNGRNRIHFLTGDALVEEVEGLRIVAGRMLAPQVAGNDTFIEITPEEGQWVVFAHTELRKYSADRDDVATFEGGKLSWFAQSNSYVEAVQVSTGEIFAVLGYRRTSNVKKRVSAEGKLVTPSALEVFKWMKA